MNFTKLLSRAKAEKNQIDNYVDELIKNYEFNNKIRQRWLKGLRPDGSIIGEYLNGSGLVDLTDTTEMGKQIEIFEVSNYTYAFGSGVPYYEYIVEMFGLDNFNITLNEKLELFNFIMLEVQNKYYKNVWDA
jgi:hypothetical protein